MMNDPVLQQLQHESIQLLDESFAKIQHCLRQLSQQQVWFRPHPSMNSIGNLLLHIAGNLRQWVVSGVGGHADTRARDAEFSADGLSVADLVKTTQDAIIEATVAIESLTPDSAIKQRTIQGFEVTGTGAIMHSVPHFVGHTHQIILLTRLQLGDAYQFAWSPDSRQTDVPI